MEKLPIKTATIYISLIGNVKKDVSIEEIFLNGLFKEPILLSNEIYFKDKNSRKFVFKATLVGEDVQGLFWEIFVLSNKISSSWMVIYDVGLNGTFNRYSMISDKNIRMRQVQWANIEVEF